MVDIRGVELAGHFLNVGAFVRGFRWDLACRQSPSKITCLLGYRGHGKKQHGQVSKCWVLDSKFRQRIGGVEGVEGVLCVYSGRWFKCCV